jgi:hypothetical protein
MGSYPAENLIEMVVDDLNTVMDYWLGELDRYTLIQLTTKPDPSAFSLGQLYIHLISDTTFYLEQMNSSLRELNNLEGEMVPIAKMMFENNSFPNERLKGDPSNDLLSQPETVEQLAASMRQLKHDLNELAKEITGKMTGKTLHPGFGFFNAHEWLQFAEMHFRHHLRQKKSLDTALTNMSSNAPNIPGGAQAKM